MTYKNSDFENNNSQTTENYFHVTVQQTPETKKHREECFSVDIKAKDTYKDMEEDTLFSLGLSDSKKKVRVWKFPETIVWMTMTQNGSITHIIPAVKPFVWGKAPWIT